MQYYAKDKFKDIIWIYSRFKSNFIFYFLNSNLHSIFKKFWTKNFFVKCFIKIIYIEIDFN